MSIRVFITGGTFDKEYNEITGQLYFNDSHLPEMLELGRSRQDAEQGEEQGRDDSRDTKHAAPPLG